jgi:hypothetical protein
VTQVMLAMLYGVQQSQAAFIIPLLPEIIEVLAIEELWYTRDLLMKCSQYHSITVLTCSQLEIVLQEENLAQISDERRHYPGNIKMDRRPGQLVGLVNLGRPWHQDVPVQVVASRKSNAQPVLSNLQLAESV